LLIEQLKFVARRRWSRISKITCEMLTQRSVPSAVS